METTKKNLFCSLNHFRASIRKFVKTFVLGKEILKHLVPEELNGETCGDWKDEWVPFLKKDVLYLFSVLSRYKMIMAKTFGLGMKIFSVPPPLQVGKVLYH